MKRFSHLIIFMNIGLLLYGQFIMDEQGERTPKVSSFCYEYPGGFKAANLDEAIIDILHEIFPDSKEEVKPTKLLKNFRYPKNDTICISYTQSLDSNNPDKPGVSNYHWFIPKKNVVLDINAYYGDVLPYQPADNQLSDSLYAEKIKMIYLPDRKFRGFIAKAYIKDSKVVKIYGLCRN